MTQLKAWAAAIIAGNRSMNHPSPSHVIITLAMGETRGKRPTPIYDKGPAVTRPASAKPGKIKSHAG
jgi:hypothetical protein